MDGNSYRLVPYRFLVNESNTDICKLERLTNLFPDMKEIIELELFKINNLSHMIERLSNIYTISSAVNTHDDTLHLFLGPYQVSLGPAIFGALQFKNVSKALLASTNSKNIKDNTKKKRKRRHEFVIRRFRRAVRKLLLIKSILDQLRFASVLTPSNQYELHRQGIYDLVLSGHIHETQSIFIDENFHFMNNSETKTNLSASHFIKVNALLNLLSAIPQQNQVDNNPVRGIKAQSTFDNSNTLTNNEDHRNTFIDPASMCCVSHGQIASQDIFPIRRSLSYQSTQFAPSEYPSKRNSNYGLSTRSSILSRQTIATSLPDLTISDDSITNISSSYLMPPSNSITVKLNKMKNDTKNQSHHSSSGFSTNQEDTFVNHISSLISNYLLSNTKDNPEILENNLNFLPSITTTVSNNSDISNQSLSINESNEFYKLLQRIRTVVNNELSIKTHNNNNSHQQLFLLPSITYPEAHMNEFNTEYRRLSNDKHKLDLLFKSQSFDVATLQSFSTRSEFDENVTEFDSDEYVTRF